jgi:hypothetical protein
VTEWDYKRSKPPPEADRVAVVKPDFDMLRHLNESDDSSAMALTWLGHAAMLVSTNGMLDQLLKH